MGDEIIERRYQAGRRERVKSGLYNDIDEFQPRTNGDSGGKQIPRHNSIPALPAAS
jgi:hypothetical protein